MEGAVLSGSAEQITAAVNEFSDGMLSYFSGASLDSLNEQAQHYMDEYHQLLEYSKNEGSTVTQEQLDESARTAAAAAYKVFEYYAATGQGDTFMRVISQFLKEFNPGAEISQAIASIFTQEGFLDYIFGATTTGTTSKGGAASVGTVFYSPAGIFDPSVWNEYSRTVGIAEGAVKAAESAINANNGATAEKMQQLYTILGLIFGQIENMDLTVELDGDVVANKLLSRVDRGLGQNATSSKRGSVKD